MRQEFQFFHTFDRHAREHYNVEAGSIITFNAERFHTKYEKTHYVFTKVRRARQGHS